MSEANMPTPSTPEVPNTFRFLGQDLRPLSFGELVSQAILFLLFAAVMSWLAPSLSSPASLANSFLMLCFWNAGLRLSVASILFFFGLAIFGVQVFEGVGRMLGV